MRKILVWCRSRRWLTAMLVLLALGVGLHFFFQWHSERRWQRYYAEARARGVKLTITEVALPEVPDERNFAALPMLRAAFAHGNRPFALPQRISPFRGDLLLRERTNWEVWRDAFLGVSFIDETSDDPVRDVLRALERFAPQFQEWSEWRTRPECRFPLDLQKGPVTPNLHLPAFRDAAQVFVLRMRAHLALGDSAAAYADFREGFQGYLALRTEPELSSGREAISELDMLLFAVGDGLRDHVWSAEDLAKIEVDLAVVTIPADLHRTLSAERVSMLQWWDHLATLSGAAEQELLAHLPRRDRLMVSSAMIKWRVLPRWVLRDNEWRQNLHLDAVLSRVDATGNRFKLDGGIPSPWQGIPGPLTRAYYRFYLSTGDIYSYTATMFVRTQVLLDQARVAFALERHFQLHGEFPSSLHELPQPLPNDLHSHSPFHYRRETPRSFRLYSVGQNRIDDGGAIDPKLREGKQADDIWLYAPPGP